MCEPTKETERAIAISMSRCQPLGSTRLASQLVTSTFAHHRANHHPSFATPTRTMMLTPMMSQVSALVAAKEQEEQLKQQQQQQPKTVVVCTCGAREFEEHKHRNSSTAKRSDLQSAKRAANGVSASPVSPTNEPKRSLWRKILGKGPKCTCGDKCVVELVTIPSEYVGCSKVCVSGKRVPFSRDMTQRQRASWNPLDAIEEDE